MAKKADDAKKSIAELKKHLKYNNIGKLYLFTGPEQYLVRYYVKEIIERVVDPKSKTFNFSEFSGNVTIHELEDAVSIYPVLSQRRLIIVKESKLTKASGKGAEWDAFFKALPDYICLIFIQEEVDKRVSFYKAVKKYGLVIVCNQQDEIALTKWVMKAFASYKKQISANNAAYLVSLLEPDMTFIALEIEKIVSYMGQASSVSQEIIDGVASKSLKSRVFDLTEAIAQHKTSKALQILNELIEQREPVPYIMASVARQIGLLLKVKKMEQKGMPRSEMTKVLGLHPFIIGKIQNQASSFSVDSLKEYMRKCMEMDLASKTGRMDGRMALELFIIEMGSRS
jgi:DNA polymerase-3 subunit delta